MIVEQSNFEQFTPTLKNQYVEQNFIFDMNLFMNSLSILWPHLRPKTAHFRPCVVPKTKNDQDFGRVCGRKMKTSCRPRLIIPFDLIIIVVYTKFFIRSKVLKLIELVPVANFLLWNTVHETSFLPPPVPHPQKLPIEKFFFIF